jgi:hypothetical protein
MLRVYRDDAEAARLARADGAAQGVLAMRVVLAFAILSGCGSPEGPLAPPYVGPESSNLPLVVIDTRGVRVDEDEIWDPDGTRGWAPVRLTIVDVGAEGRARFAGPPSWSGAAGMHVRGHSTLEYPKLQYALETWDETGEELEVGLLGMPPESDWVLEAPYADKTLLRDALVFRWSNAIGRWAPRTRFVELFVRDDGGGLPRREDYRGVYVLTEKVKRSEHRVAITPLEPGDEAEPEVSGGYLWARDWWDEDRPETWLTTEVYGDVLLWESPRFDRITAAQKAWAQGFLGRFEAALASESFRDPDRGYLGFVDRDSFVDHMLLVEVARPVDGYVLSTFVSKDRGGPLTMGPLWDLDASLGNADYYEAWRTDGWHYENPDFPEDSPNAFRWYERMLEDPDFVSRRRERWAELRAGPLSTERLVADVEEGVAVLQEAAPRNFERWPLLGRRVWPNDPGAAERRTWAAEIDYLERWLTDRVAWMDEELGR